MLIIGREFNKQEEVLGILDFLDSNSWLTPVSLIRGLSLIIITRKIKLSIRSYLGYKTVHKPHDATRDFKSEIRPKILKYPIINCFVSKISVSAEIDS